MIGCYDGRGTGLDLLFDFPFLRHTGYLSYSRANINLYNVSGSSFGAIKKRVNACLAVMVRESVAPDTKRPWTLEKGETGIW